MAGLKILENVNLSDYTTFKIGGPAKYFFAAKGLDDLIEAVKTAKEQKLPYFILGGGSNLLINDSGFNGLIIKMEAAHYQIEGAKIFAEAGVRLSDLLRKSLEAGLTGLEWAIGIPGTIGGAVRGNTGAFRQSISNSVKQVKVLDKNFKIYDLSLPDCRFNYRESRFKHSNEIILSAELELKKGDKTESQKTIRDYLKQRSSRNPAYPSAGCVFKNPLPQSAGRLIEQAGLRGKQIGQAMIPLEHANFIINLGGAKAKDVLALMDLVKKTIKEKFKIDLEKEVQVL